MKNLFLFLTLFLTSFVVFSQNDTTIVLSEADFDLTNTKYVDIEPGQTLNFDIDFPASVSDFYVYSESGGSPDILLGNLLYDTLIGSTNTDFKLFIYKSSEFVTIDVAIINTSSVGDNKDIDFKIYPNPATDFIKIQIDGYTGNFYVLDMTGKTLIVTDEQTIDISNLPNGKYVLYFDNKSQIFLKS